MFLGETAQAAQSDAKTEAEVGFIQGDTPVKPNKPTEKPLGRLLPKTGEDILVYTAVSGIIILGAIATVYVKRKIKG
ncbi:hypothetical protein RV15_GL001767 [Enterococcus silesiacus]|uniref:Gram-positive cocci surface proteins LPxTG domain-containing protein n=1 Tax=Enterococcus silesiacus TaxID=332949 RepID=A0AA91GED2_9ENTE|nr:hypothetical protein RV15_GL001767 [Enterococcus silesiacus]